MAEQELKKRNVKEQEEVNLIRVLGKDLRGDRKLLAGLAQIKGISWTFANAVVKTLKLNPDMKIQDLGSEGIKQLEDFMKNPEVPGFLKNRQNDFDDGEDKHVNGADLKLRREFDVKRLRKIKSYRGNRHALGLPVRGQRTKANFRKNRKKSGAVGVKKKK